MHISGAVVAESGAGLAIWLIRVIEPGFRTVQIIKIRTNSVPIVFGGIKKVRKFTGGLRGKR